MRPDRQPDMVRDDRTFNLEHEKDVPWFVTQRFKISLSFGNNQIRIFKLLPKAVVTVL